jgi:AraC family transcriptional regulator
MLSVALAVHLLNEFRRDRANAPRIKGRLSAARTRRVLEFMRANLGETISISSLAQQAAISEAHFARAFRATLGESPHQLLLRWRLQWAQRLIEKQKLSAAEAAAATGFYDQAHFTNTMRKRLGITPGRVRK